VYTLDITVIIVLILFVIGAVIAFKIIKSLIKAALAVVSATILIILLISFLVYADYSSFNKSWPDSEKLALLDADGQITAGLQTNFSGEDDAKLLDESQISSIQSSYTVKDISSIKGNNYKVIIIKLESLIEGIHTDEIKIKDEIILKQDSIDVLMSENALADLTALFSKQENIEDIKQNISSNVEAKSLVFGVLLQQLSDENGSGFIGYLISEYKKGNIIIYPETAMFKLAGFMPDFIAERLFKSKNG
jgi:hypothetical protein